MFERLGADFSIGEAEPDQHQLESRLQRWYDRAARGDQDKWQERLQRYELDDNQAKRALREACIDASADLPSWAATLREVLVVASEHSLDDLREQLDPTESRKIMREGGQPGSVPFQEFLLPFLVVSRRMLCEAAPFADSLLTERARFLLEQNFLTSMAELCWRTLHWEFSIFRSSRRDSVFWRFTPVGQEHSRDLYQNFVERIMERGLLTILGLYPVLARLMATRMELWVEATAEFLQRVKRDLPLLQRTFARSDDAGIGILEEVMPGLSDPHDGARTVFEVTFTSGLKLIYKPRNLALERAWFRFLGWMNQKGPPLEFKVALVLDRSTYGWVEYIPQLAVGDVGAAKRYFQRAGFLLALLHILEGTDCHSENVIAHGEHPVLVDLEMILSPRMWLDAEGTSTAAEMEANELYLGSVLRCNLLPQWYFESDGSSFDRGGLGVVESGEGPKWQRLEHRNTDGMELVNKPIQMPPGKNELFLNGKSQSAVDYIEEVISGFEWMYRFVSSIRDRICRRGGPLDQMKAQKVRFGLRTTRFYGQLLSYILQPCYLRDGVDWSIELEVLWRRFVLSEGEQFF